MILIKYHQHVRSTPLGYAVGQNKKEIVEAIASIPGVNFSMPVCVCEFLAIQNKRGKFVILTKLQIASK